MKIVRYPNSKLSSGTYWSDPSDLDYILLKNKCAMLCKKYHGVALAAPQIGLLQRWFYHADWHEIIVNPRIVEVSEKDIVRAKEGCLSIPGLLYEVERYSRVKVEWETRTGWVTRELKNLDARIFQHEIDHLNGICVADK